MTFGTTGMTDTGGTGGAAGTAGTGAASQVAERTAGARTLSVAFLIDRWEEERGGAERALAALARHLEQRGHRVLAFARRASAGSPGEFHAVAAGGISRTRRERALARALVRAAREAGADVTLGIRHLEEVDVFWPHAGAHAAGLAARERSRRRAPRDPAQAPHGPAQAPHGPGPTVVPEEADADGDLATGRHALFTELEAQLCRGGGARRIVCVSKLVADELAALYPECAPRLATVRNGIDLARFDLAGRAERGAAFRARHAIPPDAPLIAFVAHDAELKGLPVLLDALALIRDGGAHLLLAGARPIERWKRRAERVLPEGRVHAFAAVDASAALSAADVLAHPTWRDTSGLVLLEALAVGTPVVTTRAAGEADTVSAGPAGPAGTQGTGGTGGTGGAVGTGGTVLEEPGDALALARALEHWLARSRAADFDRAAVRACVEDRGLAGWLSAMEAIVVAAAR